MSEKIILTGTIGFDPQDKTNKHVRQSSWKRIAMVFIGGDVSDYYAWFLKKRYNISLVRPLRGPHVSFINDSNRDLSLNGKITMNEVDAKWEIIKNKWNGVKVPICLDLNPRTDDKFWWLNVHQNYRDRLHGIRAEIGLERPYAGLHMTLGYANEHFIEHSKYIHTLIKTGLIK